MKKFILLSNCLKFQKKLSKKIRVVTFLSSQWTPSTINLIYKSMENLELILTKNFWNKTFYSNEAFENNRNYDRSYKYI